MFTGTNIMRTRCKYKMSKGTLSSDDNDGGEYVALKVNLRSFNLYRDYLNSLCPMYGTILDLNVKNPYESSERIRKFRRNLFTSSIKHEIGYFHVVDMQ